MATEPKVDLPVGEPKDLIAEMSLSTGTKYLLQNRADSHKGVLRYYIGGADAPTDLSEGQDLFQGERLIINVTSEKFWAWGHVDDAIAVASESS